MMALKTQIRLYRRATEDAQRRVAELDLIEEQLLSRAQALEQEIVRETAAASGSFEAGLTFRAFAEQARRRRVEIERSIMETRDRRNLARDALADTFAELKKYELAAEAERDRSMRQLAKVEQASLDEIGLGIHRRISEGV